MPKPKRRRKSRFVVIDDKVVPRRLAPAIVAIKRQARTKHNRSLTVNSGFRGDEARGLLRRLGAATQSFLFNGWIQRLPGFNPANPPKQGTHELYSDGVAYRGPRGRQLLSDLKCGIDWSDPDLADRCARELGLPMRRPYPDPREAQHRNFYWRPGRGPRSTLGRERCNALMEPWRAGRFPHKPQRR